MFCGQWAVWIAVDVLRPARGQRSNTQFSRWNLILPRPHEINAARQAVEPVEQLADGRADQRRAMLGRDHGDVELAHHAHPELEDFVAHHISPVKGLHARRKGVKTGEGVPGFLPAEQRHAQIAGEQDFAHRVIELEVALGMHEVRRQQPQAGLAVAQSATRVGDGDDAVIGLAQFAEVRGKPGPEGGNHQLGLGGGHPAVERGDDVGVGMRGQDVVELARRDVFAHGQAELVVGHVSARIEDDSFPVINDQELVGLHRFFVGDEIGEQHASVVGVFIEFDGHGTQSREEKQTGKRRRGLGSGLHLQTDRLQKGHEQGMRATQLNGFAKVCLRFHPIEQISRRRKIDALHGLQVHRDCIGSQGLRSQIA